MTPKEQELANYLLKSALSCGRLTQNYLILMKAVKIRLENEAFIKQQKEL